MRVEYYIKVIKGLLDVGCKQADIARALKRSRTNISTMLGNNKHQRPPEDLTGAELRQLIKLCKKHKIEPSTWAKLGKMIEREFNS